MEIYMRRINNKDGFTLAEVLITLAIIGVIAALTIPNLIQSTKNAGIVVGVRKAQSELSQAYVSFVADGTTMDIIHTGNAQHVNVLNQFATKLNIVKNCGTETGCFPGVIYKFLDGSDLGNYDYDTGSSVAKAILADGSSIAFADFNNNCDNHLVADSLNPLYNACGYIQFDINGFKPPNQLGRDFFSFYITRSGIYAWGSNNYGPNDCNAGSMGFNCAGKILTEGTVNY